MILELCSTAYVISLPLIQVLFFLMCLTVSFSNIYFCRVDEAIKKAGQSVTKSKVWLFFEKPEHSEAKCKICKQIYKTGGGTSNFRNHLK